MDSWEGSELNKAKEILAFELTALVHGKEEAEKALEAAKNMFSGAKDSADIPATVLNIEDLTDGQIGILDIMVKSGLCSSKGEARTLVQQGGVTVNEEKVNDVKTFYSYDDLKEGILVRKGKKKYARITL